MQQNQYTLKENIKYNIIICDATGEAVFARCLSALKSEREAASQVLKDELPAVSAVVSDNKQFIEDIRQVCCIAASCLFLVYPTTSVFIIIITFYAVSLLWAWLWDTTQLELKK